jgi:hypothetical protein
MSVAALATLNELFFEICRELGLDGGGAYSFPDEFFEVLSSPECRAPYISVSRVGGRLVAYVECGGAYAVAEILPSGERLRGRGLGYIECEGRVFTVKKILEGTAPTESRQGLES